MEKFIKLTNEMKEIENKRREFINEMEKLEKENQEVKNAQLDEKIWALEIEINDLDNIYEELSKERAFSYKEFYDDKTNTDFTWIRRWPNLGTLKLYLNQVDSKFPLYDYGNFSAFELAEIIKYIYQFQTRDKCSILTLGTDSMDKDIPNSLFGTNPHLYFAIGTDKSLESVLDYNGKFYNSPNLYNKIYLDLLGKGAVFIDLDLDPNNSLGIKCLTGSTFDDENMINYFDNATTSYVKFGVSKYKQIFSSNIDPNKILYFTSILDFKVSNTIFNILVSIVIYKRNNGIIEFTEEDYNHIFNVLYGKKVSIKEDVEKDFKRELIYIPNAITKR